MNRLKSERRLTTRTAEKDRNEMREESKTKKDLISELAELHQRIAELESQKRKAGRTFNEDEFSEVLAKEILNATKDSREENGHLSDILIRVQEEERKRIAHDLHDVMGHTLTAIKLSMENLAHDRKAFKDKGKLTNIIDMIQNANKEVHQIIYALRPPLLDDLGLVSTVSWFCRNTEKACPWIFIEQQIDMSAGEPCDYLKIIIFRVMQEAINNVIKHSNCDRVRLFLSKKNNLVKLVVEDNGVGFNMQEELSGRNGEIGMGLFTMKGRTESSGGLFSISTTMESGTVIQATWPCKNVPACCAENCRKGNK